MISIHLVLIMLPQAGLLARQTVLTAKYERKPMGPKSKVKIKQGLGTNNIR